MIKKSVKIMKTTKKSRIFLSVITWNKEFIILMLKFPKLMDQGLPWTPNFVLLQCFHTYNMFSQHLGSSLDHCINIFDGWLKEIRGISNCNKQVFHRNKSGNIFFFFFWSGNSQGKVREFCCVERVSTRDGPIWENRR